MVDHISTRFVGPIRGVKEPGLSLKPTRGEYPKVRNWYQSDWLGSKPSKTNKSPGHPSNPGTPDSSEHHRSSFMEDQFGQPIPEATRKALRADVAAFWIDMIKAGDTPENWTDTGLKTRETFRTTMEGKYSWLRLCEAHWKIEQTWKNCFTSWKTSHLPAPTATTAEPKPPTAGAKATSHTTTGSTSHTMIKPTSHATIKSRTKSTSHAMIPGSHKMIMSAPTNQNPKKKIVIEIDSSDENSSAGSKHKLEDDPYAKPLKKRKGKEVAKSDFHHPRPVPKKKVVARVAKVRASLFPLNRELLRDA